MPFPYTQLVAATAAVFSICAVAFDLKERRIPNAINAVFLALAMVFAFVSNSLSTNYLLFVIASFAFAYSVYKLGAWAGGDAKFFTALMAFLPLLKPSSLYSIPLVFIASAFLLVPVLVVLFAKQLFSLRAEFSQLARSSFPPAIYGAIVSAAISVLFQHLVYPSISYPQTLQAAAGGFLVVFLFSFLKRSFSVVSERVLRRKVAVSSLREGDIPAQSVYLRSGKPFFWSPPSQASIVSAALTLKPAAISSLLPPPNPVVDCMLARGVSVEEIRQLKKAGVREIELKESVPFAPALALGFGIVAWLL